MRVFVDTNVLVYLFDADAPAKQVRARETIADLVRRKALVLSSQVLGELFVTLTRKLAEPLTADEAGRVVADLSDFPVVALDAALVSRAVELSAREQLSYWDAQIVVAATAAGATTLYTEDLQPGRRFGSVTVVDPFAG